MLKGQKVEMIYVLCAETISVLAEMENERDHLQPKISGGV